VTKNSFIVVQGVEVGVKDFNQEDYISLTDMLKAKDGEFFITDWLRNRNTLEYIGIWEQIHNPDFNYGEFATIRNKSGLNNFKIGVQDFAEKTNSISLRATAGRYGGTYAHKDIAFEFALWISAEFKVYFIKEFQRLKNNEQEKIAWSAKRELARINYHIHTDAIQDNLILPKHTPQQRSFIYAEEADLLNVIMFGKTARRWLDEHEAEADKGENIRDYATLHQLLVLANLESHNAAFNDEKLLPEDRFEKLRGIAERELEVLSKHSVNAPLLLDTGKKKKDKT
jgi:hypothetical protein